MQNLMNVQYLTMSSLDFLNNIINPSREAAGENPVRPSDFHARVNDEIGEELNYENFVVGELLANLVYGGQATFCSDVS